MLCESGFRYDRAILDAFPTVRAAVVAMSELRTDDTKALSDEYGKEQAATLGRLTRKQIAEIPSVAAWRRAFSRFGVKPTQYRSAVEALLRRLSKAGDVPEINPLVDIGNLVSVRHVLPVAVFDLDQIEPPITVRFASGDEVFHGIGTDGPDSPAPGEVIFMDARGVVCARRWCWRQSATSAADSATSRAMIVIEGHHASAAVDVDAAARDVVDLAERHLHATVGDVELVP